MNVCYVITFATIMLLRDFGLHVMYLCVGRLVGDHLLFSNFGPYGTFMMRVCYSLCCGNAVQRFGVLREFLYVL
jgi:hypothetical protein